MSDSKPVGTDVERVCRERDLYLRLLQLGSAKALDALLEGALELVVDIARAKRGYLEIRDAGSPDETGGDATSEGAWSLGFGVSELEIEDIQHHISRGIIAEAIATGETIATNSAVLDERFGSRESVQKARLEAVICAPIASSRVNGVVYLEGRQVSGGFSEEDQAAIELFAEHLASISDRLLAEHREIRAGDALRVLRQRYELGGLVGRSPALAHAVEQAMLAAPLDVAVLLTGPSGTGKTALARSIHANSRRADGPFVEINCAALPASLIESELFGARAGAHSEARRDVAGKVSAAEGGTLFLDEVAELPLESQAKLLQLLQARAYFRLGDSQATHADVRLIAASNAALDERVREGRFREDLFFRLHVLPVQMPSVAARGEDVIHLAESLLSRAALKHGLPELELSISARRAIRSADWPGNVRQLENALEAALIRAAGNRATEVSAMHLFPDSTEPTDAEKPLNYQEATRRFQRELLEQTLEQTNWNVSEAARRLGLGRSTIYELISSFGMSREKRTR